MQRNSADVSGVITPTVGFGFFSISVYVESKSTLLERRVGRLPVITEERRRFWVLIQLRMKLSQQLRFHDSFC